MFLGSPAVMNREMKLKSQEQLCAGNHLNSTVLRPPGWAHIGKRIWDKNRLVTFVSKHQHLPVPHRWAGSESFTWLVLRMKKGSSAQLMQLLFIPGLCSSLHWLFRSFGSLSQSSGSFSQALLLFLRLWFHSLGNKMCCEGHGENRVCKLGLCLWSITALVC